MDWNSIIVAAFAFAGTLIGSILANNKNAALITYRIDQLEKKVEKHNTVIERTFKLEQDLATAFVRIDEVRNDVQELKHN